MGSAGDWAVARGGRGLGSVTGRAWCGLGCGDGRRALAMYGSAGAGSVRGDAEVAAILYAGNVRCGHGRGGTRGTNRRGRGAGETRADNNVNGFPAREKAPSLAPGDRAPLAKNASRFGWGVARVSRFRGKAAIFGGSSRRARWKGPREARGRRRLRPNWR